MASLGRFYRNSHEVALDQCDPARGIPPLAKALRDGGVWITPTFVLGGTPLLDDLQAEDSLRAKLPGWVAGMTRIGARAYEALRIATRDAAEFIGGLDSLGSIEVGRLADLVLLGANPLEDIRNTLRIRTVVLRGRVITATR